MTYLSARGIALVATGPADVPVLTVENYCKWYTLHVIHPDGHGAPVGYDELEAYCSKDEMSAYVDHAPNPVLVERMCDALGWYMDPQSYEMMVGRWIAEGLSMTMADVHRRVRS